MSASIAFVSLTFNVADVVGDPGVSPLTCRRILTGMQLRKFVAGEATFPTLAMTPMAPGATEVTRPLVSIVPTALLVVCQKKVPTRLVISFAPGPQGGPGSCGVATAEHAWAVNCCVCVKEVQPVMGSTTMEEMGR